MEVSKVLPCMKELASLSFLHVYKQAEQQAADAFYGELQTVEVCL